MLLKIAFENCLRCLRPPLTRPHIFRQIAQTTEEQARPAPAAQTPDKTHLKVIKLLGIMRVLRPTSCGSKSHKLLRATVKIHTPTHTYIEQTPTHI